MYARFYWCLLFAPALGLWLASLYQPALKQPGGTFQYSGMYCFMIGWIGIFGRLEWLLPWSANVLFWITAISGVFRAQLRQKDLVISVFAIGLALVALTIRTIEMNEGGERAHVTPGLGFYLWLGSMIASSAAVFFRLQRAM